MSRDYIQLAVVAEEMVLMLYDLVSPDAADIVLNFTYWTEPQIINNSIAFSQYWIDKGGYVTVQSKTQLIDMSARYLHYIWTFGGYIPDRQKDVRNMTIKRAMNYHLHAEMSLRAFKTCLT